MSSFAVIRARIESACERAGRNPNEVTLVGASKTVEAARLIEFHEAGLRDLGENYVLEGVGKIREFEARNGAATWHLIGGLQSNKARDAVRFFELIHSLDRPSLAKALDKEAQKIGKIQRVLIQVNLGEEASKNGVLPAELGVLLEAASAFENLKIEGLMSLPPFHPEAEAMRPFHRRLRELRDGWREKYPELQALSMGMSRDFEVAIEEGATFVRVGTSLFGARE